MLSATKKTNRNNIAIIGLGFVGLPLALSFALKHRDVIGVDNNNNLIAELKKHYTPHVEYYKDRPISDILAAASEQGFFEATDDYRIAHAQANSYIVTVGIPVINGKPFYDHFVSALTDIAKGIQANDLILIRSTVVPGTTMKIAKPILEEHSGLIAGKDFHLAYASERIAEGKAFEEFANMPTALAGIDHESFEKAKQLLQIISSAQIYEASSIEIVETAKVFENVARDVNIAMAQQFAEFTQAIGIDINETIAIANTHKRVNLLSPGPGVGGYCLPNAYHYLTPVLAEHEFSLPLLELARNINNGVPERIVNILESKLVSHGKSLKSARIGVLGLAMKDYSNDDRISPAHHICELLIKRGAKVYAYDPLVTSNAPYLTKILSEVYYQTDAILILTRQREFIGYTYRQFARDMNENPILIDTRNMVNREEMLAAGFDFFAI
jgi:UDP-N-acetyl-D-mannosaminuronic acid dehydrogenase